MKGLMSRYGYVDEVITDNGSQFGSAELKSFVTEYGFRHVTSSPHYPQSNGQAARMVQTIKNLTIKDKNHIKQYWTIGKHHLTWDYHQRNWSLIAYLKRLYQHPLSY